MDQAKPSKWFPEGSCTSVTECVTKIWTALGEDIPSANNLTD